MYIYGNKQLKMSENSEQYQHLQSQLEIWKSSLFSFQVTEKEKYKDKEVKHDLTRRALEGGNWSDRDHPPSMVNTLQCPPNITLFTEETFSNPTLYLLSRSLHCTLNTSQYLTITQICQ